MSKKLSFSIAVNLLTENFKKGANTVKNSFRSMQMQIITFAAALGAGGLGLMGLISRFRDVARETSRVITALKNVSTGTKGFADSLRFLNNMSNKYGLYINTLVDNFAKFTASATQANMPMEEQKKIFESLSRATAAFSLSAEQTDDVFLALSQMMSKGKINMEELRKQMGEKLPIAMQAMAKALGVSMAQMEKLIGSSKVIAADVLPKFADALNEMIPNVDTDNLESSISRLKNAWQKVVDSSGFQNKYKALIDWLTQLIQSAGKNIQNIVTGIVAAIAFVVTRKLTGVYQGYAATGQKIIANATITHNKLRAAIKARVEAEKRLEELKLQHAQAVGAKQVSLARQVEQAKQTLSARTAAVTKAHESAKAAAAQAAAIKSRGAWATAGAAIVGTFKRIGAALKSMWNSFAPAIIISGIVALVMHFRNLFNESKRIKNIFSDYRKEAQNIGNTQEVKMLQAQLAIMNDKTKSQKEVNAAQGELQKMLGAEKLTQEEINKRVAKRIDLLKAAAEADFYAQKAVETEDKIRKQATSIDFTEEQVKRLAGILEREGKSSAYNQEVARIYREEKGHKGAYSISNVSKVVEEVVEDLKVLADAEKYLSAAGNKANLLTTKTSTDDPDDKTLRAAEKRLEALRKLDEEDRKRQIEKQKFDLEMRQATIDLMTDSFEKQQAQTLLNFDKEKLAIEEAQNELIKKQADYAKTLYESVHGDTKGFEAYFAKLKESDFKGKDGIDILPEGLRPEDIADRVRQMLNAAQGVFDKANADNLENERQQWNEYYKIFGEYLLKKQAIAEEYADKIRKAEEAGNIAEATHLKRQQQSDIASAETAAIKAEIDWQLVFGEFGNMFASVLRPTLKKAEEYMQSDEFKQADHASQKELITAIGEMRKVLGGKGTLNFKKLGQEVQVLQETQRGLLQAVNDELNAKKRVIKAEKAYQKAVESGTEAQQAAANADYVAAQQAAADAAAITKQQAAAMNTAQQGVTTTATALSDTMQNVVEGLSMIASGSLSSAFKGIIQTGETVGGTMGKLADKLKSVPIIGWIVSIIDIFKDGLSIVIGGLLDAIFNAVSGIISDVISGDLFVTIGKSLKDGIGKIFNALSFGGWNSLMDSITGSNAKEVAETTNKLTASNKVLTQSIDALKKEIEKARGVDTVKAYDDAVDKQKERIKNTADILAAQMGYHASHHSNNYYIGKSLSKDDYARISERVGKTVKSTGDLWSLSPEDLQKVSTLTDIWEKITTAGKYNKSDYIDQYLALAGTLEELENGLNEALTQVTFDSLYDNFVDTLMNMDTKVEDFADDVSEYFMRAMLSNKVGEMYADKLEGWYKKFAESMKDGTLSSDERNALKSEYMNYVQEAIKLRDELAKATGYDTSSASSSSQDSTKGYSTSMDQDTGGAILGRITGIHESIIEIKTMMSAVNLDTAKTLTQNIAIGDELKKHTGIFHEMQQMQQKSYFKIENIIEGMKVFDGMKTALDEINKNTKKL